VAHKDRARVNANKSTAVTTIGSGTPKSGAKSAAGGMVKVAKKIAAMAAASRSSPLTWSGNILPNNAR
jgi:hypothetical protein